MGRVITLLLGAGASKPLGILTTKEMASEFLSATSNRFIKRINHQKIDDIEKLIKTIQKVIELKSSEGITLLKEETDMMKKIPLDSLCSEFQHTHEEVTRYVREQCSRFNKDKAESILAPLLELQTKGAKITIFSTNYDTAIESVCNAHSIPFADGFIRKGNDEYPRFHPSSFIDGENNNNILLYKLHGSVNWWSDDDRQVIFKLSLELNGVKGVKNLMIYPAQKEDVLNFPYNVLESAFIIKLHTITDLIAVGHKFGDANIASAVRVALERSNFKLTLVNLEAKSIKKNIFNDHERVVAIEEPFEEWVKKGVQELAKEPRILMESNPRSKQGWIVESYHGYYSNSILSLEPEFIREGTLTCPSCSESQFHKSKAASGYLMCENCKNLAQYAFPK